MSDEKLKQMVSEVITDGEFTDPSVIANRINKRFEGVSVSTKGISEFLEEEYYPEEEFRKIENKHRGLNGRYYI